MSKSAPNAETREKRILGLLLRRLSTSAKLTDAQNAQRDKIYELALEKQYEQTLVINKQLLDEASNTIPPADNAPSVYGFFEKLFKRSADDSPNTEHSAESDENIEQKIAVLALDRAVLFGLNGQPSEATMLLENIMESQGTSSNYVFTEEIFEVAGELAELAGDQAAKQDVNQARIQYYYDLALASGDESHLETALQALELTNADIYQTEEPATIVEHVLAEARLLRDFGIAHEQTELIRRSANNIAKAAENARQNGKLNLAYTLDLERYSIDVELAKLLSDAAELNTISNRLRDFIELPDTMLGQEGRADARHLLGYCLTLLADIDGKVITLRKAFGYLESAAKKFAEQGLEGKELRSLKDLALAKVTAAELLALDSSTGDTDLVLARRYNAEAMQIQEELTARLAKT